MENDSCVNEKNNNKLKQPLPENFKPILRSLGVNSLYYEMTRKKVFLNIGNTVKVEDVASGVNPFGEDEVIDCFGELEPTQQKNDEEGRDILAGADCGEEFYLDDNLVTQIELECIRQNVSTFRLSKTLAYMASLNSRCFISEWICSKPWDGQSRIVEWMNTIQCADGFEPVLKMAYMYRWALSAVAMLFNGAGTSTKGVLVLQGDQGIGKTTWVRKLCETHPWAIGVGVSLDPHNKDSKMQAYNKWINELGELDSTLRRDIGALKAEIGQPTDEYRKPYAETAIQVPRRTVFCASVNDEKFLKDPTGNDRWYVMPVTAINYQHDIDMQQFWAEVYTLFMDGDQWHLTPEEHRLHRIYSRNFEEICPLRELIDSQLAWEMGGAVWMNATQVAKAIGLREPKKSDSNTVARILKEKYNDMPNMVRTLKGQRLFLVPHPISG